MSIGTGRAERIFTVLAAYPAGLCIKEIVELAGEQLEPRHALNRYADVLRESERKGHVRRIGYVPALRGGRAATIWQLTPGTSREEFIPRQQRAREENAAAREKRQAARQRGSRPLSTATAKPA